MPGTASTFARELLAYYEAHFSPETLQDRVLIYNTRAPHYRRFVSGQVQNREPPEDQRAHLLRLDPYTRRKSLAYMLGLGPSDAGAILSHPEYFHENGRKKGLFFRIEHATDTAPLLECDPYLLVDGLEKMYHLHPFEPDLLEEIDLNVTPTQAAPFRSGFVRFAHQVLAIVTLERDTVRGIQQLSVITKQHAPMPYGNWYQYLVSAQVFPNAPSQQCVYTMSYPLLMHPEYRLYRILWPSSAESVRIRMYSHLFSTRCLEAIVEEHRYITPLQHRTEVLRHIATAFGLAIPNRS